jgi:hypothetical protein
VGIYQRSRGLASWRRHAVARRLILIALLLSGFLGCRSRPSALCTHADGRRRAHAEHGQSGADDFLIDLGSGDGRLVREAALRFGARGMGIERDPELIERSTELARRQGVTDKVAFVKQDLFEADIGDASVLTMYLLPAVNMKLRPRLLATLKPGTRIVSHDFDLGDWQADETAEFYSKLKYGESGGNSKVFLWIVPADVSGRWTGASKWAASRSITNCAWHSAFRSSISSCGWRGGAQGRASRVARRCAQVQRTRRHQGQSGPAAIRGAHWRRCHRGYRGIEGPAHAGGS